MIRRAFFAVLWPLAGTAVFAQASEQPVLTAVKAEFIPGERTVFYDDLTDMADDAPPPHWKVRGGMAELRAGAGVRQLNLPKHGMVAAAGLRGLPANFTLEADWKFEGVAGNGVGSVLRFRNKSGSQVLGIELMLQPDVESPTGGVAHLTVTAGDPTETSEQIAKLDARVDPRQPMQTALWVQEGRLRFYANGARLVDANQVKLEGIATLEIEAQIVDMEPSSAVGIRRVRLAESAPDFSKSFTAWGRFVTHGILFDTGSDRIRPESAPVIRQAASYFEANPGVRMVVEGHTDSTGNAESNLELSRRRAEAVRTVLVTQFKVDPGRVTAVGFGATKPMDTNETAAGRAQNRRVEFARQ